MTRLYDKILRSPVVYVNFCGFVSGATITNLKFSFEDFNSSFDTSKSLTSKPGRPHVLPIVTTV